MCQVLWHIALYFLLHIGWEHVHVENIVDRPFCYIRVFLMLFPNILALICLHIRLDSSTGVSIRSNCVLSNRLCIDN